MANIGTKNGSNGRERDFVKRQERARTRSATANATMPPRGSSVQSAKSALASPHADAGGLANTMPEGLSQNESKIHDDGKTCVVKRCVQTEVEPNARKRRHGARGGKRVGKPPFTDINHRTGKGADPKGNIDH